MKKTVCPAALCLAAALLLAGCAVPQPQTTPAKALPQADHTLVLAGTAATLDGAAVPEYDYVWHCDVAGSYTEVKDCPAEYYTGTAPDAGQAVYVAHDIAYFPQIAAEKFTLVNYDGEREYAAYYEAEEYSDYIFGLLPASSSDPAGFATGMMHTAAEAYQNPVLHITQPGVYALEGQWQGQILVDLGDKDATFTDETAAVTLILNGVTVECTVAPALIFSDLYEADHNWAQADTHTQQVELSSAGATLLLADGTVNEMTGTNVYRMLKTKYKTENDTAAVPVQKKNRKIDGAVYSYVSMRVDGGPEGTGVLNITSGFEGLDSELHLALDGGCINIASQNDGINTNEDGVSVAQFNGAQVRIAAGLGDEGDGIDSNGYVVVNGGTVVATANPRADSGMDSDCGTYIYGGTVVALGSAMDLAAADEADGQAVMNLRFAAQQPAGQPLVVTDTAGTVVLAYDPAQGEAARSYAGAVLSAPGLRQGESYHVYVGGTVQGTANGGLYDAATVTGFSGGVQQGYTGTGAAGHGFEKGQRPDGFERPDGAEPPQGFVKGERPEGSRPDEGFEKGRRPERPDGEASATPPAPPEGDAPAEGQPPMAEDATPAAPQPEFALAQRVTTFGGVAALSGFAADEATGQVAV